MSSGSSDNICSRDEERIPELMMSGDNRQVFMFVRRVDRIYILYKIDALDLYRSSKSDDKLLPLIIFEPGVLPDCECSFAYLEPYFYIVGENKNHVFTLKRDRLVNLDPSENYRGRKFVKNIRNPMNVDKLFPLAFAYDGKLYVLSRTSCSSSGRVFNFEVYSPCDGLWRVLARRPLNQMSLNTYFLSYLILGTRVYFTTNILVVVCFDLKAETWGTFFDPYGALTSPTKFIEHRPLFQAQTQVIGNRIFGIFTREGTGPSDICASSSWKPHEDLFLRPNLAPDKKFFHDVFGAPTKLNTDISAWRTSIVTLDEGARIMGVVCYCSDVLSHGDELSGFATLSIFQVDAEPYSYPTIIKDEVHRVYWNPGMFSYAREEDHVEYFRAKLLHNTSLFIKTKKEFTYGVPCSCFFV